MMTWDNETMISLLFIALLLLMVLRFPLAFVIFLFIGVGAATFFNFSRATVDLSLDKVYDEANIIQKEVLYDEPSIIK